jgi:hypothetical protein
MACSSGEGNEEESSEAETVAPGLSREFWFISGIRRKKGDLSKEGQKVIHKFGGSLKSFVRRKRGENGWCRKKTQKAHRKGEGNSLIH